MRYWTILLLGLTFFGCMDKATFLYGDDVSELEFYIFSPTMGIHPDDSVLDDPKNPFADPMNGFGIDPSQNVRQSDTKWIIEAEGSNVLAFYAWATLLVREPIGEHQYYVADKLYSIYQLMETKPENLPTLRDMTIGAYQSVLENFPDAHTYDATGTLKYELVTPSYEALLELGGAIPEGWILVKLANGKERAIKQ